MKKTIAVASPSFSFNPILRKKIIETLHSFDIKFCLQKTELKDQDLTDFLQGAEYAIIGKEKITFDLLKRCPKLRYISKYGVGLDNINFEACREFGVGVLIQEGTNRRSVAELSLGLMFSVLRKIAFADRELRKGLWKKHKGRELSGSTVGIIGCGNVGTELIKLLKPFNCKLLLNDIKDLTEVCRWSEGQSASKEEIFIKSDIISLHIPLTELTENLINRHTLKLMSSKTVLINTSRGSVVCEEDLYEALKAEQILGAGLDVFPEEPLSPESKLLELDNLVMTAHMGAATSEASLAMGEGAISSLQNIIHKVPVTF